MAIIIGLPILYMRHSDNVLQQQMGNTLMAFIEAANEVVLKILNGILQYAPLGVLGITASTIGSQGIETLIALGKFVMTSYAGVILLLIIVYPLALRLCGVQVMKFYKYQRSGYDIICHIKQFRNIANYYSCSKKSRH